MAMGGLDPRDQRRGELPGVQPRGQRPLARLRVTGRVGGRRRPDPGLPRPRCRRPSASPTCCSPRPGTCWAPRPTSARCGPWSAGVNRAGPGDAGPAHPDERARPLRHAAARPRRAARPAGADRGRRQRRAHPAVRPLLLRLRRPGDRRPRPAGADAALRRARARAAARPAARHRLAGRAGPQPAGRHPRRRRALAVLPGVAGGERPRGPARRRGRVGPPRSAAGVPRRPAAPTCPRWPPRRRPRPPWSSTTPRCWPTSRPRTGSGSPATSASLGAVWLSNEAPGVVPGLPLHGRAGRHVRARPRRPHAAGPHRRPRRPGCTGWPPERALPGEAGFAAWLSPTSAATPTTAAPPPTRPPASG